MSALAATAVVVVVLVMVVGVLLAIPIHVAASGVFAEHEVDASAEALWAFGAVCVRAGREGVVLFVLGWPVYRHLPRPESDTLPADEKKKKRWRPGLRFVWRVGRRLLASLRIRSRVFGRSDLPDPARRSPCRGPLCKPFG